MKFEIHRDTEGKMWSISEGAYVSALPSWVTEENMQSEIYVPLLERKYPKGLLKLFPGKENSGFQKYCAIKQDMSGYEVGFIREKAIVKRTLEIVDDLDKRKTTRTRKAATPKTTKPKAPKKAKIDRYGNTPRNPYDYRFEVGDELVQNSRGFISRNLLDFTKPQTVRFIRESAVIPGLQILYFFGDSDFYAATDFKKSQ